MSGELTSADIALKYLEMARSEISEKVQFVNKTLGAYLLGVSAITSWFYQSVYQPSSSEKLVAVTAAEKSSAAIGLALILSYLALGVIWIIYHNESMVTALAYYQRDELFAALKDGPPMWEQSNSLNNADGPTHARGNIVAEELIVLVAPLIATCFAFHELSSAPQWPKWAWFPLAFIANALNAWIAFKMNKNRRELRETAKKQLDFLRWRFTCSIFWPGTGSDVFATARNRQ